MDKTQYPVKAISRKNLSYTEKVEFISTDSSEIDKLAAQLEDIDVFIELLGPSPDTLSNIEKRINQASHFHPISI